MPRICNPRPMSNGRRPAAEGVAHTISYMTLEKTPSSDLWKHRNPFLYRTLDYFHSNKLLANTATRMSNVRTHRKTEHLKHLKRRKTWSSRRRAPEYDREPCNESWSNLLDPLGYLKESFSEPSFVNQMASNLNNSQPRNSHLDDSPEVRVPDLMNFQDVSRMHTPDQAFTF